MKKRLFTTILILFVCLTSVFCLNNTIPKSMDGTFLYFKDYKIINMYFDTEMENFIFFEINIDIDDVDNTTYLLLSGDISKDYGEDNDYTLYCYNEDSEFVGTLSMTSVLKNNGMKVSIPKLGIVSFFFDKVSKEWFDLEDTMSFIEQNMDKYDPNKITPYKEPKVDYKKELDGSYFNLSKNTLTFFFIDKETESFVFYRELFEEEQYILLYGDISKDYGEDKKYTLYSFNEDYEFVGTIPMTMVYRDKGIKTTMNNIGLIGVELEKISNDKLSYDDLMLYLENNKDKYKSFFE